MPGAASAATFSDPANFAMGNGPRSVAVGDFDGDSDQDLVVANFLSNNLSVRLNDGTGHFSGTPATFAVGSGPEDIAVADFNGDSDPDVAVPNRNSDTVSVLLGIAGASFAPAATLAAGDGPGSVAIDDFNGDSDPDLAIANYSGQSVSVRAGAVGGSFGAPVTYSANWPESLAVGNFNGDADPDIAIANVLSFNIELLLGTTGASFANGGSFAAGPSPKSIEAGNFDADSDLDLAVINNEWDQISVLLNSGGASFGAPASFPTGDGASSIAVGNFDTDSDLDLAVANSHVANVSVLLNNGVGSFGTATNFAAGVEPWSIAAGNLNGDSAPDLAVANYNSDDVSVLLNRPTGYVRPKGATPIVTALVIAYDDCLSPNATHGGSLTVGQCNPPVQFSNNLTVGTPDVNGAAANFTGSIRLDVCPVPGCVAPNVRIQTTMSDVRCKPGVGTCGAANSAGGADYTGEIQGRLTLRITDNNPPSGTTVDSPFNFTVACTPTSADATKGSDCNLTTAANTVLPGAFSSGNRANVRIMNIQVFDGGADGNVNTPGNVLFLGQGFFVP
jgi:hypothetical protein